MKRWRRWLLLAVGFLVSVVFVYLALKGLNLRAVWHDLQNANYWWLIPGIAVYFVAVWARTWRWHYLLRPIQRVPLDKLFPVVVIGYMGNNVYPFRAGEVIRAYILERNRDVKISASLATIIVERIFDGLVMLIFVFVALPFAPIPPPYDRIVIWMTVLFFGALLAFFVLALKPAFTRRLYVAVFQKVIPVEAVRAFTITQADRFLDGLASLRSPADMAMTLVSSVLIWLTETTKYWFVMHAFDFHVSFFVLMLMTAVVNLATTLPSSPGYVGTFDEPGIEILKVFGVGENIAAAYTLVLHAALWLPITLLGFFFMAREGVRWSDFAQATQAAASTKPDAVKPLDRIEDRMKVAVIGAGAAGLAAAYDLAGAGHEVVVFEAGEEVGGLAAGFKDPAWDWTLEKFYHHWFSTDHDVLDLIDEIGTGDKVRFLMPITSIWQPDGNYPLDAPTARNALLSRLVNVLGIPGLSLIDKLRFGTVGMFLKLWPWGLMFEKYTADAWLRRWVGERAHNAVWRPLLIGKFGEQYDRVNMAWMWARAYKRTASLGTYVGGFQAMLEDLADAVRARGADIRLSTPVEDIRHAETGLALTARGEVLPFDRVLVTAGPRLLLRLTGELPEAYARKVGKLQSMGAIALILSLDRQLMIDNTYWLNLPADSPDRDQNPFPFLALVEHTNYLSPEYYNGERIVYLGDYLPQDHEHFQLSEEELADKFLPSLTQVNPDFSRGWIKRQWLFRVPYAQPVPYVNHSQNIPAIRTPVEGLYWASMSQVYPWDRGTNYAVEIGRRTARMMMEDKAANQ